MVLSLPSLILIAPSVVALFWFLHYFFSFFSTFTFSDTTNPVYCHVWHVCLADCEVHLIGIFAASSCHLYALASSSISCQSYFTSVSNINSYFSSPYLIEESSLQI
ncbi:unnamed protein product [Allacma fusca]|uniref:Uncharacterized protein n=1 Tax=Allacma fusca TaxID=39272 RepID=A0A8J2JDR2_9HEXA|nr:unnamed protein product [Allacma fusca]